VQTGKTPQEALTDSRVAEWLRRERQALVALNSTRDEVRQP